MNYLQKKKLAFMSIVNRVKGFIRTVTGVFPLTLANCVDSESITDYSICGNSVQNGTPTPDTPVEVESVGEQMVNLFDKNNPNLFEAYINTTENKVGYPASSSALFVIPCKGNTIYTIGYNYSLVNNSIFRTACIEVDDITTQTWTDVYNYNYTANTDHIIKTTTEAKAIVIQIGYSTHSEVMQTLQVIESDTLEVCGKYKIPIAVSGKNLLKPSNAVGKFAHYGVTFTVNKDYSITINGTAIQTFPIEISTDNGIMATGGTYTLCGCFGGSTSTYYLQSINGFRDTGNGVAVSTKEDKNRIWLYLVKDAVFDNVTIYPMLIKGNYVGKVPDYEPYHESITTNIYLDEPLGQGQSISYKKDNLPIIPTFKGTTILTVGTTIQPSNAEVTYYSTSKE